VRKVGVLRQTPGNKDVNIEVEGFTELEAITRRQSMKAQKTEKI
jgi:hypothetical protein